jgi:hypothetical protein
MARMLRLSGMRGDNAAGKSLGLLGASNAVFMNAIDSVVRAGSWAGKGMGKRAGEGSVWLAGRAGGPLWTCGAGQMGSDGFGGAELT